MLAEMSNPVLRREAQLNTSTCIMAMRLVATEINLVFIFFSDMQMYQYYIQVGFLCKYINSNLQ